jgi:hypothetical protein
MIPDSTPFICIYVYIGLHNLWGILAEYITSQSVAKYQNGSQTNGHTSVKVSMLTASQMGH